MSAEQQAFVRSVLSGPRGDISGSLGVMISTVEGIQAGLYFGNRAAIAGLTREIRDRVFQGQPALVIATGGFCRLFEGERLFDVVLHDLVLIGLERALSLNPGACRPWRAPV